MRSMSNEVSLKSKTGSHGVKVTYPQMPYLGLWHKPLTEAPYVCIEPWSSLPSRKGIIEDLATKPGLIHLDSSLEYENQYVIEII